MTTAQNLRGTKRGPEQLFGCEKCVPFAGKIQGPLPMWYALATLGLKQDRLQEVARG